MEGPLFPSLPASKEQKSVDWVTLERRFKREDDEPYLELLRAVQQTHAEAISKLTDTVSSYATTLAVQAQTIKSITDIQVAMRGEITSHDKALEENSIAHARLEGSLRTILWGVPLVISFVVVIVNGIVFLLGHTGLPK